jgi:hypothetical protein
MWAKHILLVVLMVILNTDKVLMSEWMDSRMVMAVKTFVANTPNGNVTAVRHSLVNEAAWHFHSHCTLFSS